jgi:hypothetical protein
VRLRSTQKIRASPPWRKRRPGTPGNLKAHHPPICSQEDRKFQNVSVSAETGDLPILPGARFQPPASFLRAARRSAHQAGIGACWCGRFIQAVRGNEVTERHFLTVAFGNKSKQPALPTGCFAVDIQPVLRGQSPGYTGLCATGFRILQTSSDRFRLAPWTILRSQGKITCIAAQRRKS